MQKLLFVLSLFLIGSVSINAQAYHGNYTSFFDSEQPDARSEALGKVQVVLYGNPSTSFYNPASSSFSEGLNAEYTHLKPQFFGSLDDSKYNTYGISYNSKKYGAVAFTMRNYFYGKIKYTTNDNPDGNNLQSESPETYNYTFNYSYMPISDLSVGINLNYFRYEFFKTLKKGWSFDIGALKRVAFETETNTQNLFIGASLSNVANNQTKSDMAGSQDVIVKYTEKYPLPSNFRIGASYDYETKLQLSGFKIFKVMASTEYSDLLNSKFYTTLKGGAEFTFLEMLKLRLGYYNEKINDNTNYGNKENLSEFTYGAGINIPIQKIFNTKIPISLQFDYANLEAPSFYDNPYDKNYSVFNLSINVGI